MIKTTGSVSLSSSIVFAKPYFSHIVSPCCRISIYSCAARPHNTMFGCSCSGTWRQSRCPHFRNSSFKERPIINTGRMDGHIVVQFVVQSIQMGSLRWNSYFQNSFVSFTSSHSPYFQNSGCLRPKRSWAGRNLLSSVENSHGVHTCCSDLNP